MRFVVWSALCGVMYFAGHPFLSWFPIVVLIGIAACGGTLALSCSIAYHVSTEGQPPETNWILLVVVGAILAGAAGAALISFAEMNPTGLIVLRIMIVGLLSWVAVGMMFIPNTYVSY